MLKIKLHFDYHIMQGWSSQLKVFAINGNKICGHFMITVLLWIQATVHGNYSNRLRLQLLSQMALHKAPSEKQSVGSCESYGEQIKESIDSCLITVKALSLLKVFAV